MDETIKTGKATRADAGKVIENGFASNPLVEATDYIVPSYSEQGKKLGASKFVGDQATIISKAQAIMESALRAGGTVNEAIVCKPSIVSNSIPVTSIVPTKSEDGPVKIVSKKGKRSKTKVVDNSPKLLLNLDNEIKEYAMEAQPIVEKPSVAKSDVVFSIPSGKIKSTVIGILDLPNALALVFETESDVRYEPEAGGDLEIVTETARYRVMYPGFKFTWIDGVKQIMVFVKTEE